MPPVCWRRRRPADRFVDHNRSARWRLVSQVGMQPFIVVPVDPFEDELHYVGFGLQRPAAER